MREDTVDEGKLDYGYLSSAVYIWRHGITLEHGDDSGLII
jgi:hypothetical protein